MDKTPAQIEAEGDEHVEIEWLGHTFSVPATAEDWDVNVTRAFAAGDLIGAIEALVGKARFARIEAAQSKANGGRVRNRDLTPHGARGAELPGVERPGPQGA